MKPKDIWRQCLILVALPIGAFWLVAEHMFGRSLATEAQFLSLGAFVPEALLTRSLDPLIAVGLAGMLHAAVNANNAGRDPDNYTVDEKRSDRFCRVVFGGGILVTTIACVTFGPVWALGIGGAAVFVLTALLSERADFFKARARRTLAGLMIIAVIGSVLNTVPIGIITGFWNWVGLTGMTLVLGFLTALLACVAAHGTDPVPASTEETA